MEGSWCSFDVTYCRRCAVSALLFLVGVVVPWARRPALLTVLESGFFSERHWAFTNFIEITLHKSIVILGEITKCGWLLSLSIRNLIITSAYFDLTSRLHDIP